MRLGIMALLTKAMKTYQKLVTGKNIKGSFGLLE